MNRPVAPKDQNHIRLGRRRRHSYPPIDRAISLKSPKLSRRTPKPENSRSPHRANEVSRIYGRITLIMVGTAARAVSYIVVILSEDFASRMRGKVAVEGPLLRLHKQRPHKEFLCRVRARGFQTVIGNSPRSRGQGSTKRDPSTPQSDSQSESLCSAQDDRGLNSRRADHNFLRTSSPAQHRLGNDMDFLHSPTDSDVERRAAAQSAGPDGRVNDARDLYRSLLQFTLCVAD